MGSRSIDPLWPPSTRRKTHVTHHAVGRADRVTPKILDVRKVLVSPLAIGQPDWLGQLLPVSLTKAQVEKSPDIDTKKTVSRQQEAT